VEEDEEDPNKVDYNICVDMKASTTRVMLSACAPDARRPWFGNQGNACTV
jgi:hypothetical protein